MELDDRHPIPPTPKAPTQGMRFCELVKEEMAALSELPESSEELQALCEVTIQLLEPLELPCGRKLWEFTRRWLCHR